jgi:hypothetical protein
VLAALGAGAAGDAAVRDAVPAFDPVTGEVVA